MHELIVSGTGDEPTQILWRSELTETVDVTELSGPPSDPWTADDATALRWYLEDYIGFPHGAESFRALDVETRVKQWGQSLFRDLFGPRSPGRRLYERAVEEGLGQVSLQIRSDDPAFLRLPWEYLEDSEGSTKAPALGWQGLYRSCPMGQTIQPLASAATAPFRILLVIARPGGFNDVRFRSVAGPLLEALEPLADVIELQVLRPPSFSRLKEVLLEATTPFNLVHFDGHGRLGPDGAGELLFEAQWPRPQQAVSGREIAELLARARVPLLALNACQSAMEDPSRPFGSVATEAFRAGAQGVLAMGYTVLVDTARLFFARFYGSLTEGHSLLEAVTEARKALADQPQRIGPAGAIGLQDWSVPVVYLRDPGSRLGAEAFGLGGQRPARPAPHPPAPPQPPPLQLPEHRDGFVGRDSHFLALERHLGYGSAEPILVNGLSGVGKTTVIAAFAHWYHRTGGCPGGVIYRSLDGLSGADAFFAGLPSAPVEDAHAPGHRCVEALTRHLREHRCLLLIDRFELTCHGSGDVNTAQVTPAWRPLIGFLEGLEGGETAVILCSATGDPIFHEERLAQLPVRGLDREDTLRLAQSVLRKTGLDPEPILADPDFPDLLDALDGHPQAILATLPALVECSPGELEARLLLSAYGPPSETGLEDRWAELSEGARRALPQALCLCSAVLRCQLLAYVSAEHPELVGLFEDRTGFRVSADQWRVWLREAERLGLVTRLSWSDDAFAPHPLLAPWMRLLAGGDGRGPLDDWGPHLVPFWQLRIGILGTMEKSRDGRLSSFAETERRNVHAWLMWSVTRRDADLSWFLFDVANRLARCAGRPLREAIRLRKKLIRHMGVDPSPNDSADWMARRLELVISDLQEQCQTGDRDRDFESVHRRLLEVLDNRPVQGADDFRGRILHNLAVAAHRDGDLDSAYNLARQALGYLENEGRAERVAVEYQTLGAIERARGNLDEAEQWLRRAPDTVGGQGLTQLAQEAKLSLAALLLSRGDADLAEDQASDTLASASDVESRQPEIQSMLLLGQSALRRDAVEEAEDWGRKVVQLAHAERSPRFEAAACMLLSEAAIARKSGPEAHQWAHSAMELLTQDAPPGDRAQCYYLMGVARVLDGDATMATRFLEDSAKLFGSVGQTQRERDMQALAKQARDLVASDSEHALEKARSLDGKNAGDAQGFEELLKASDALVNRDLFDQALPLAEQALIAAERLGEADSVAKAAMNLGRACFYVQRYADARQCLERAYGLYRQCDDQLGMATSSHQLARALQSLGDYPEAMACLQRAEGYFAASGNWVQLAVCLGQQGFLSRHIGDHAGAVARFVAGYNIAAAREPRLAGQIVTDLAQTLEQMGDKAFAEAWRKATDGQEPPIDWLRGVLRQLSPRG